MTPCPHTRWLWMLTIITVVNCSNWVLDLISNDPVNINVHPWLRFPTYLVYLGVAGWAVTTYATTRRRRAGRRP